MPLNYQDINFNNGQYIPQYAGIPLKEVQETADVLSARHYQNLANASHLEILANQMKSKLLPGAKSYVDTHISSINTALQDIAKSGGENSTARINALATALQGDETLLTGLQQAERVNKELSIEQELLAKGQQPVRKQGIREAIMNAPINDQLYKTPYQSTVEPYQEPVPFMESIWKTVNPDSIEGMIRAAKDTELSKLLPGAYVDGQLDLPLFFENVTKAGISQGKIQGLLNSAWSSYQQTPSYKQQKDLLGKTDAELKKEFYNHGLLRTFENISRDYRNTSGSIINGPSGNTDVAFPTTVPGQTLETLFNYSDEGKYPAKLEPEVSLGHNKIVTLDEGKGKGEFHPQYLKDYKTMAEIKGQSGDIKPDSKEAKALAQEYKQIVGKRVSNPWITTLTPDQILDQTKLAQAQYALAQYIDPNDPSNVITAFDSDNKPTDEWLDLTGGDPSKFKVEGVLDPKNHYTIGSNEKFVRGMTVVSQDGDGNLKRFIMSQKPMQTNVKDVNTNAIYTKVNLRPGQEIEISPRVKARELHGAQVSSLNLTPEQMSVVTMPVEATIDGKKYIFPSPEKMSEFLITKGITLSTN